MSLNELKNLKKPNDLEEFNILVERETEDLLCSLYEAFFMNLFIVFMSIRKASSRETDLNNLINIIYY